MIRVLSFQYLVVSLILILMLTQSISLPIQKRVVPVQGSSSETTTSQESNENGANIDGLSTYENPNLGFKLKYPSTFHISEVTSSPESTIVTFRMNSFAPTTGAFISINATKWKAGIDFDELRGKMVDTLEPGPGVRTEISETTSISGIPVYKVIQNHENSPYGRDATAVFMAGVVGEMSYLISSLSSDAYILQQILNSLEFIN
jgi:hypothetical protein